MPRPSRQPPRHDPVRTLCKLAGAADLDDYLGMTPSTSPKEALVLLERKRRDLEASLSHPGRGQEAELFLELYPTLRDRLRRVGRPRSFDRDTPDYYGVLGVQQGATYAAIERAWRQLQSTGQPVDPLAAQAWRVLGDPLNRANYDRARREVIQASLPDALEVGPEDADPAAGAEDDQTHAELPGPAVRDVLVDPNATAVVSIPLVVTGQGRWRASVTTDHPCLSTRPERRISVAPGKHTLAVHVDPRHLRQGQVKCSVTLSNAHEQHVVEFRVRRSDAQGMRRWEPVLLGVLALTLLAVGWWLGTRTTISRSEREPTTVGVISQIPSASVCFSPAYAPLPRHVDVYTDGLGRPTGFSLEGAASPESEACVRTSLMSLDFPPTRDGQPAMHRYLVPSSQGAP